MTRLKGAYNALVVCLRRDVEDADDVHEEQGIVWECPQATSDVAPSVIQLARLRRDVFPEDV